MRTCIWCKLSETDTLFNKKAHTIPKSLGGHNFNLSVCDDCNHFFGNATPETRYSIETALKETFCLTRQRFLLSRDHKKQVGRFKSIFFEVKERNGKLRFVIKQSFLFKTNFQKILCRNFKRGLIKMWFEEVDRQSKSNVGLDSKYDIIRDFARYNKGEIPLIYFERHIGLFLFTEREAETPVLIFNRMKYLYQDDIFIEIEFLGHVFGFPIHEFSQLDFENYIKKSLKEKEKFFSGAILVDRIIDIDFMLSVLDK